MQIVRRIAVMQRIARALRMKSKSVGFVPTMGALHAGHLSLIRAAQHSTDVVVVSIFVNPTQFGPGEDYKKYPRVLKRDFLLCTKAGVDFVFCPSAFEMFPKTYQTYVEVENLSKPLCGRFRAGHFRGVATVVLKLFHIIQPAVAYFGWKDAQQALLICAMVKDLCLPVKIKIEPIVREDDHLAMSSRNVYLNARQRREAAVVYQSLLLARRMIKAGERRASNVVAAMRRLIGKKKEARIQYIHIVDPDGLKEEKRLKGKFLIALAVWFGKTRLIDNMMFSI